MLVIEKSLPGGILVNERGERFVNEACAVHRRRERDVRAATRRDVLRAGVPGLRRDLPQEVHRAGRCSRARQQPDWMMRKLFRIGYVKTRRHARRTRAPARRRRRAPRGVRAQAQRVRAHRQGPRVPARRHHLRPLLRRRRGQAEPVPRADREAALLRIEAYPGELGTKGGLQDRRARARAQGDRRPDSRSLRDRQLLGLGDGAQLSRRGGDDRAGDDLRLHRGVGRRAN